MRKKILMFLMALLFIFGLSENAKAANREWEKRNDPLYEKYNNENNEVYEVEQDDFRSQILGASKINWGRGLKHDPQYKNSGKVYGIDVSKWQGEIDWKKVRKSGVEFAIIRLGFRGKDDGKIALDECFENNITGANDAGVRVGVYFYTQAITKKEAKSEADFCIKKLEKYKDILSFPIFYDIENTDTDRMGRKKVTTSQRTAFCQAFCDEVIDNGYDAGIYASLYYFNEKLKVDKFSSDYHIWLARYAKAYNSNSLKYEYPYEMWQYSDGNRKNKDIVSVKVPGINENVDLDVWYMPTPEKVTYLKQSKITTDSITLSWRKQSDAIKYEIAVFDDNDEEIVSICTKKTKVTVDNLDAGTIYKFKVRACFQNAILDENYGPYSETFVTSTRPEKVGWIKGIKAGYKYVTLKWEPVKGATGYRIYIYNKETGRHRFMTSTSKNKVTIYKLSKKKKYYFKVKPYSIINGVRYSGQYSDAIQMVTRPDK